MRRSIVTFTVIALSFTVSAPASAADTTKYKNCAAVNAKYKHGIAKQGFREQGGALTGRPYVNTKLYIINKSRDRDKDGVACEQ